MGFGLFVHFGLYSVLGKGEWAKHFHKIPDEEYETLTLRFRPKKHWADDLVREAKKRGRQVYNADYPPPRRFSRTPSSSTIRGWKPADGRGIWKSTA